MTHGHAHTHISGVGDSSLEAKLDALVAEMRLQLGLATDDATAGIIARRQRPQHTAGRGTDCADTLPTGCTAGVEASLSIPSSNLRFATP